MPTDIELLLTRIGSEPVRPDSRHFYALRRALLNSRYFESHRRVEAITGWMNAASVAVAGSVVVFVMVVATREAVLRRELEARVPVAQAPAPAAAQASWVPLPAFAMEDGLVLTVAR